MFVIYFRRGKQSSDVMMNEFSILNHMSKVHRWWCLRIGCVIRWMLNCHKLCECDTKTLELGKGKDSALIKMLHIQISSVNYGVTHKEEAASHMIIAFLHHQFSFINFQVQNPNEKKWEINFLALLFLAPCGARCRSTEWIFDYFWRSWIINRSIEAALHNECENAQKNIRRRRRNADAKNVS